jgi:hypothetical protein
MSDAEDPIRFRGNIAPVVLEAIRDGKLFSTGLDQISKIKSPCIPYAELSQ